MPSPLEVTPPLPPVTSAAPIRASMDRALTETMAKLPPSSGRGFVELDATNTGLRLEAAARLGKGWSAGGWVGLARSQKPEYGVRLRGNF